MARRLKPLRVTPPSVAPVSLEEAKAHLRILDNPDEDGLIIGLIDAAVGMLDGYGGALGGRAILTQTWRDFRACFGQDMRLSIAPATSIESIAYTDKDGATQTVDLSAARLLDGADGPLVRLTGALPAVAAEPDAVRIDYRAGYGDQPTDAPAPIKSAVLLLVGHLYMNREAVTAGRLAALPIGISALIAPYRRLSL